MADKAVFIGWQLDAFEKPAFPLYNVMDPKSPLYKSTVSAATLKKIGIPVPITPKYYDQEQLDMGIKVEMEHTADKSIAEKIAKDHLDEIPDYYTRLAKMEGEAGVKNPANKSYRGETDVKAIGRLTNPRPGMMMVVNPSGPALKGHDVYNVARELLISELESFKLAPQKYIESMGWDAAKYPGIDSVAHKVAITIPEIEGLGKIIVKNKIKTDDSIFENDTVNDYLVNTVAAKVIRAYPKTKKNPALLVINPGEKIRVYDHSVGPISSYSIIIGQAVYAMDHQPNSPQGVNQYVGELEDLPGASQGRPVAIKSLPAEVQKAISARMGKDNPARMRKLPGQEIYRVTSKGRVHAKGTTKAKAAAQVRIINKAEKKNPMVKDMTSHKQKQQIKQDLKKMAKIPKRDHPEFTTLEQAADYVEKNIGKVLSITQGTKSYVIRHSNGITPFSTTKDKKIVML